MNVEIGFTVYTTFCPIKPVTHQTKFAIIRLLPMASKDRDDEEDVVTHQFKVILLGDGAVGKTSIASRFAEDKFSQNYKQTVGVDFFIKRIDLPRKPFYEYSLLQSHSFCLVIANMQIALQIWDIGGQVRAHRLLFVVMMITNHCVR